MTTPTEYDTRQTTIQRPAPFIESAGTAFTKRLTPLLDPANAIAIDKLYKDQATQNVLAQQGLQQAAQQAGLGTLTFGGPGGTVSSIADPDPALGQGVAGYQPFLTAATDAANAISNVGIAGQGAGAADIAAARGFTGPQAYQQFMSPYQQQVIDATRASFENQRAQQRASIADAASQYGAFGGGRQGVQEGVYDAQTTLGITGLEADLRAQGYQQAQQAAQQAYMNQLGLAGQMQNQVGQNIAALQPGLGAQTQMAQLQPQLTSANISNLQSMGSTQQALQQAIIDQTMAEAREEAYEPQQRLGFYGSQFAPFTGGFGAASQFTTNTQPPPSTLNTILGVGGMAAGLMGGLGSLIHGGG